MRLFRMRNVICILALIISSSAFADIPLDTLNCMTEQDAFLIEDELFEAGKTSNWVHGLLLEGRLEECISKGSVYAQYILGKWKSIQSSISASQEMKFNKQGNTEYAAVYSELSRQDSMKAIKLLEGAGESGYALANFKLGEIYKEGVIVRASNVKSGKYFVKAGFSAFADRRTELGIAAYENALEVSPEHPELNELKNLVYQ